LKKTDAVVWVVDSADRRRLDDCKKELHNLLQQEKLAGASLLIFANKQDLKYSLTETQIADVLNLKDIKNRHWCIGGCSAVTGRGLLSGIDWVVNDIASRIFMIS